VAAEIELEVDGAPMRALFEKPKGKGPFPGVVMTFHRGGLDEFSHWLVEDLAARGFLAIAPDHFHWLPSMDEVDNRRDYLWDTRLAKDLAIARSYLEMQDEIGGPGLGILGHCMGGRTALLGACVDKRYKAACLWYGGNSFKPQGEGPAPTERVSGIGAKVMGFYGNLDKNPSPEDVNKLDELLTQAGVWHEFHRYDETGHGFMDKFGKHYMEKSALDSWARATDFLARELAV
jgi:carboxymethylenebutenolidase